MSALAVSKVIVRADASNAVGSGHVMRCLCLADELKAGQGAEVVFATRGLPAHLAALVESHGHRVAALTGAQTSNEVADAEATLAAAPGAAWVVVDHYGLGPAWERAVRASGARLLAIDDLARPHDADLLLDQNFHASPEERYAPPKVSSDCTRLLGPRYALLRPEFAKARERVRVRDGDVRRLLVFLGGMDADNVTEPVLQAIGRLERTEHLAVDVVVGASHPALDRVRALVASRPGARCHVQTQDMAGLLADADLAVGAGGSATWERCALGVPTFGLCLAENQRELLEQGARHGFVYAPALASFDPAALALHLQALLDNPGLRHHLSRTSFELVDAQGARRVAARMGGASDIIIRRAVGEDSSRLHAWRNHPAVRAASRGSAEIEAGDHQRWFDGVLASPDRFLLIGERGGEPVGVVRFDTSARDPSRAEVSIYLVPSRIGQHPGEGAALLRAAEAWLARERPQITAIDADVNIGNARSRQLFERCGYAGQSIHYSKTRT